MNGMAWDMMRIDIEIICQTSLKEIRVVNWRKKCHG